MKKLIVAFLLAAFASMAMANERNEEICFSFLEEISLNNLNRCKNTLNEQWIEFLADSGDYEARIANKHYSRQKHLAFLNKHFTPIWYKITTNGKGQKVAEFTCINNDGEKWYQYRLKAPLKIKGKLNIKAHYPVRKSYGYVGFYYTEIEYKDLLWLYMPPYVHLQIKPNERNQKAIRENIPKWVLDGFGGEVSYEVEFEVANMNGNISDFVLGVGDVALTLNLSDIGYPSYIVADNIKFIKKLNENKYERIEQYLGYMEYYTMSVKDFSLKLKTKDDFINLHNSPNGEVLRKIYKKDFSDALIIEVPQTRLLGFNPPINEKWRKVLYFPPRTHKVKDATLGYIHESQLLDYYVDIE